MLPVPSTRRADRRVPPLCTGTFCYRQLSTTPPPLLVDSLNIRSGLANVVAVILPILSSPSHSHLYDVLVDLSIW
jgi:hypothetical protein